MATNANQTRLLLKVPYMSQLDNGATGYQECQTSAIAMAVASLPAPPVADDLLYRKVVRQYGDTTIADAHRQALAQLKVPARFRMDATVAEIEEQIRRGRPVPLGMLHHGPVTKPSGFGHWIVLIGFDAVAWFVHDPHGEQDLRNGGWVKSGGTTGRSLRYSRQNLNPRAWPFGPRSGWAWFIG